VSSTARAVLRGDGHRDLLRAGRGAQSRDGQRDGLVLRDAAALSADEFTGGEGGLVGAAIDDLVKYETGDTKEEQDEEEDGGGAYFRPEGSYFSANAVAHLLNRGLVPNGYLGRIELRHEGEAV
jgi:hypothetical protein